MYKKIISVLTEIKINSLAISKYLNKYLFINIALVIALEACLLGMLFFVTPSNFLQAIDQKRDNSIVNTYSLLNLVNQERQSVDINNLEINPKLQAAAEQKAMDIITNQYFSHTSKTGKIFSAWIKESDYEYLRVGENLAIFFNDNKNIVDAWMESEKHRQNILNPYYKETGIAVIYDNFENKNTHIIVQIFGEPTGEFITDIR